MDKCKRCNEEMIEVKITKKNLQNTNLKKKYMVCPECQNLIEIGSERLCQKIA